MFQLRKWVKVIKNGPSNICGRQPFKNLKDYGLLETDYTSVFHKFYLVHFWILCPKSWLKTEPNSYKLKNINSLLTFIFYMVVYINTKKLKKWFKRHCILAVHEIIVSLQHICIPRPIYNKVWGTEKKTSRFKCSIKELY